MEMNYDTNFTPDFISDLQFIQETDEFLQETDKIKTDGDDEKRKRKIQSGIE